MVVAWGTLLGFVAFFLINVMDLPKTGFRYTFSWDLHHPAVKGVLRDIIPIVLGLAVSQIYTILNRIFASGLTEGSISALNYANKLINLPQGIFVAAIVTVAFPALAEYASRTDHTELRTSVRQGLTMIFLIALPAACGLMLLDTPIIQLLFQRGEFDAEATRITAYALFWMCPGLVFQSITMLLVRVYYALNDIKTPLLAGAISIAANALVSWAFIPLMDHGTLGLANSLAAGVNALVLWLCLEKRIHFAQGKLRRELLVIVVASFFMSIVVYVAGKLCVWAQTNLILAGVLFAVIILAILVYVICLKLLHSVSLTELVNGFKVKSH